MKNLVVATIVVSAVFGLSASSDASLGAVNALVVGKVLACPPPNVRGSCSLQRHAVVLVFKSRRSGQRLVARERITNGHFSFALAAGHFTLNLARPVTDGVATPVRAKSHRTVRVDIGFHFGPPCCPPSHEMDAR